MNDRSALFAFSGFAHDPQRILAAVYRLARVSVELALNGGLCISPIRVADELLVASFADSEGRNISDPLYDPQLALWHEFSLAHLAGRQ